MALARMVVMVHQDVSVPSGDESSTGSMTRLIHRAEAGDAQAQKELFERCFRVVQNLADDKLGKVPRRIADGEDVALSVMRNAFEGMREGRFGDLQDREDWWQILWDLVAKKSTDLKRYLGRAKRDFRREDHDRLADGVNDSSGGGRSEFAVRAMDEPDFVLAEVMDVLFELLDDDAMRAIARSKLLGWTEREIGEEVGLTTKRVEFKWKVIRNKWKEKLKQMHLAPPDDSLDECGTDDADESFK